jgi:DNA-binding LacI/PurR family transcriptional regulator
MAATMHDVARVAKVSIKTVSNVINDYPHIRPETKQRVLDAIAQLGYQPNLSARSLRSGRTGVISLVIPELRNAYFAELADSVMRAAAAHGLSVLIEQFTDNRESELAVLHKPRQQMVDGILYSVLTLGEDDVGAIAEVKTPMVLLGDRIFNGPMDHVTMQNAEGAHAATEHLLSLGRRRLVALGAHPDEVIGSAGLRLTGYRRAMAAAGLEVDERLILAVGTWHRKDGADAMRQFLRLGLPFDGVVAFNDTLALGALRVMQEAGMSVPGEVAVIGFDDIDETRYSLPTLSTIDPGREEIAQTALRVLVERMDAAAAELPPREFPAAFRVVQRESTTIG